MLGLELERAIREAWLNLRGKILNDPQELQRRLARRRMKSLTRPPRAWCIAIRASDRRITPAHWVISPEHAMDLDHPAHSYEAIWGGAWEWFSRMFPDEFEQTVVRRPVFKWMGSGRGAKGRRGEWANGRSGERPPEIYKDEMQHIGWVWVCPKCKREVRKIYYP